MQNPVFQRLLPIGLLILSNLFMTVAWYGHLKYKSKPLMIVILASWGIAFFEYCLQVPANRWGNAVFSATQLKILQEVITLMVFSGFAIIYLQEKMRWNHLVAFGFIVAAVIFAFLPDRSTAETVKTVKETETPQAPN
jgi:uncharacterized protein (DUF486 family)